MTPILRRKKPKVIALLVTLPAGSNPPTMWMSPADHVASPVPPEPKP